MEIKEELEKNKMAFETKKLAIEWEKKKKKVIWKYERKDKFFDLEGFQLSQRINIQAIEQIKVFI